MRVIALPTTILAALVLLAASVLAQPVLAPPSPLFTDTLAQAEAGDAEAQNLLGALYQMGTGTARDEAAAVEWYGRAAGQGHAGAQANLGAMQMEGKGTAQDFASGVELLKAAAAQGLPIGIARLGHAHVMGQGVPMDRREGIRLLQQALDLGDGFAAYQLGIVHLYGYDVPKDEAKAVEFFRRSAELGNAVGQTVHAGYVADMGEKLRLYSLAGTAGNSQAQYMLGTILNDPASGYHDPELAVRWLRMAADNGNGMAEQALFRMGLPGEHGRQPFNREPLSSAEPLTEGDILRAIAILAGAGLAIMMLAPQGSAASASGGADRISKDCQPGHTCGGACPPGHVIIGDLCIFVPPPF